MNSATSKQFSMFLPMLLAWALALTACGKTDAPPASDLPAGEVEAVEGAVTAQRAEAKPRPLTVKAPVFSDDTVTTPPGSAVTIRLLHNLAQWHLEGGLSKRVDQSAAFAAPRDATPQPLAAKPEATVTASAGRHSEHEAAGSAESAVRAPEPAAPSPPPTPAAEIAKQADNANPTRPAKAAHAPPAARAPSGGQDTIKLAEKSMDIPAPPPPPPPAPIEQPRTVRSEGGGGASKSGGSGERAAGAAGDVEVVKSLVVEVQEALRPELTALTSKLRTAMSKCVSAAVSEGGELPSLLKVVLTLGTDGSFSQVEVTGLTGTAAQCVKARWLAAKGLPKVDAPASMAVTYTFKLSDM